MTHPDAYCGPYCPLNDGPIQEPNPCPFMDSCAGSKMDDVFEALEAQRAETEGESVKVGYTPT